MAQKSLPNNDELGNGSGGGIVPATIAPTEAVGVLAELGITTTAAGLAAYAASAGVAAWDLDTLTAHAERISAAAPPDDIPDVPITAAAVQAACDRWVAQEGAEIAEILAGRGAALTTEVNRLVADAPTAQQVIDRVIADFFPVRSAA